MRDTICTLCSIGQKSYYVWKNKSHTQLINLIETYFNQSELEEWLEKDKIKKFELIKNMSYEELKGKLSSNNDEVTLLSITQQLTSLKESHLRALRAALKNLEEEPHLNFQNQIAKAKIDNDFLNKLKSFFKDDEVLTQKHFINLEELLPLKLSQKEIEYMIENKDEVINKITIIIRTT